MAQERKDQAKECTFQYDETLPSLPLPTLQQTLDKYIDSVKPFLTAEDFLVYKDQVQTFEDGIGQTIQGKLEEKAKQSKNWVSQWWEDNAYLAVRSPTAILGNMIGPAPCMDDIWPPEIGTQLKRAAIYLYHTLTYWSMIRRQEIPVDVIHGPNLKLSMHQLRSIFNCGRIPGIERDKIVRSFKTEAEGACDTHIIVTCNGHMYKMFPMDTNNNPVSSHELYRHLCFIKDKSQVRGQGICSLSADDRTSYAKAYNHLVELDAANHAHLDEITSSLMFLVLDDGSPANATQTYQAGFYGPQPWNRWFDKAYSVIVFDNGTVTCNCDHAPYDGIVMVYMNYVIHKQLIKSAGDWQGNPTIDPDALMPVEIIFKTDNVIERAIQKAEETYFMNSQILDVLCSRFTVYGKTWLKKMDIHPDTMCQLAIQLAYYTMYKKPGSCYETATVRQYYKGRTDTVRSTTPEVVDWCKAMLDPHILIGERQTLFQVAYKKHNVLMQEAMQGKGCDRHLFGLCCMAEEMGLQIPDIFLDKAFTKSGGGGNFVLSTSLAGYTTVHGGVAAMTQNGYGVFYKIASDHLQFVVTCYTPCDETSCSRFYNELNKALLQLQNLLSMSKL